MRVLLPARAILTTEGLRRHVFADKAQFVTWARARRRDNQADMTKNQNPARDPRDEFINVSVWHGSLDRAQEILVAHPEVASSDVHTAALLGDHDAVARFLAESPGNATAKGGPRNW